MNAHTAVMTRVMMNRYHLGAPEAFLAGLAPDAARQVNSFAITSQEPHQILLQSATLVADFVHYSWIAPLIETFPLEMQPLLLGALPDNQQIHIAKQLAMPAPPQLPDHIKKFFLNLLHEKLDSAEILPVAFLAATPLTPLANYSKKQLVQLIDLLGIYDLAVEIRQIVDNKIIKAIYETLPPLQQLFLHTTLHRKEKLLPTPLGLKEWTGDGQQLRHLLHRRGILRLGYALSGQQPDLLWHIAHHLDCGRGKLLMTHYAKKAIPDITGALLQQVLTAINFLSKAKPS